MTLELLMLAALAMAGIVLMRCVHVAARLNIRDWRGPRWRFIGLAASFSALAAGAFGVALFVQWAAFMLLAGIAGLIVFDRRVLQ
jgi:hypothetical protein